MGAKKWGLLAAGLGLLGAATIWGLMVSVGVSSTGVTNSELPDNGFVKLQGERTIVARSKFGTGTGQAGVILEGDTRGPDSFGVDDRGRVYLLDAVNQRVTRFTNSIAETAFPLPDSGFEDIAVARDRFAVLSRTDDRRVLVFDQAAGRIATLPIAAAVPDIYRLAIVGGDILVECPGGGANSYHPIGTVDGIPYPDAEQASPRTDGVPMPTGDTLKPALLSANDIAVDVVNPDGTRDLSLRAHSNRKVASIVDASGDSRGNIVVIWGVYSETKDGLTDHARLVMARYSPTGELLGTAEAENESDPEPFRKVVMAEDGEIYQLTAETNYYAVYRWTLQP